MILSSQSPRRKELLASLGVVFSVESCSVTELDDSCGMETHLLPALNAERKASAVAAKHPDSLVLGADTLVLLDGRALGKPADLAEAEAMLAALGGREHEVVTGVALLRECDRLHEVWSETSVVRFKPLSSEVIARYLAAVPVLDKAGAYAIQDHGELLVEKVDGEIENVIGLPLKRLRRRLQELGEIAG